MTTVAAPPPPTICVNLGVTGHRATHPAFAANRDRIAAVVDAILDLVDATVTATPLVLGPGSLAPTRLHGLLADGTDQLLAEAALARGYDLVAPLPFGRRLNLAINAADADAADARALLAGEPPRDPGTAARAAAIERLCDRARVFALADQDEMLGALFLARLDAPADFARAQLFVAESSRRVALAGGVLIEQSDLIVAVWDGATTAHGGGTGHTIAAALECGAPVVWIDPAAPESWRLLRAPESLAAPPPAVAGGDPAAIAAIVRGVLHPGEDDAGLRTLGQATWRPRSNRLFHAYRRIETLFGGQRGRLRRLTQRYETPDAVATGSFANVLATMRALPASDGAMIDAMTGGVLRRFAWADGISAHLSDAYRGGMTINFILSSFAIVGGMAYLPFVEPSEKWFFATFELVLLSGILLITWIGNRLRWHGRWFETRRVAEYLRHAPLLLVLGAARAPGRWPQGSETSWPEWYARAVLRQVGLPRAAMTPAYLRGVLTGLLGDHVVRQRDYHRGKAKRLATVHRNLDRSSQFLFQLAVATVALYLALRGGSALGLIDEEQVAHVSKIFTVLGVLFPTFGAGVAGIRYFGDFERFAAISEVTAEKLELVDERIVLLARAGDAGLHYGRVAELAHATDDIVVAEIENWQAVFGGKHIAVPV